jgi:asparagine synthase (glutamine-hydrolysing)
MQKQMCGIVGLVAANGAPPPQEERVAAAVQALRHRGPDGTGLMARGRAVLGHTRLSIIDLENGAQPMANEDESVWTVFNGEIWNFQDLRARLSTAGHRFATRCDTEVLVHGYEEWGDDLVSQLNGMFAFAIWDLRRRRLLLARDRLGKKPLYVARTTEGLAFGSDARSTLLAAGLRPELDERQVATFLFQRYVGGAATLFRGVERLAPGKLLTFDGDRVAERRYWSLPTDATTEPLDPRDLRALLSDSVRQRLQSDVPVGVLLSGGIDSAAVLGLVREAELGPLETFTIGFADPVFDERPLARLTAERFGAEAHELVVGAGDFIAALPRLAWYRDEPVAEPAEIPLLLLAEFVRDRRVKVVLSGEGGDELFGGYPKFRAERVLQLPTHFPALALHAATALRSRRPSHRQLERARGTLAIRDPMLRWASWFRSFSSDELGAILAPELASSAAPEELTRPLRELLEPYRSLDRGRRLLVADTLTYLPDNMLLRGDRVLMAASVEGRMPLLDYRIVERVTRAPFRQRVGLRRSKIVLRRAVADLVPPRVQAGPKRGFPVPVARFLLERSRLLDDLVLSERALARGLFEPHALRRLVAEARADPRDSQLRLFTLVSLELWLRTNVDELRLEPPASWDELGVGSAVRQERLEDDRVR